MFKSKLGIKLKGFLTLLFCETFQVLMAYIRVLGGRVVE
jgi:hypothetical protein